MELLAEVAVLEEEVVRLEEQVVNFRQGLYQEAIYVSSSSSKKNADTTPISDLYPCNSPSEHSPPSDGNIESSPPARIANSKKSMKKSTSTPSSSPSPALEDKKRGKENHLIFNSSSKITTVVPKLVSPQKKQTQIRISGFKTPEDTTAATVNDVGGSPNRISEDTLKCLMSIFSKQSSDSNSVVAGDDKSIADPYNICSEFGRRDIGPYKKFRSIAGSSSSDSIDPTESPLLFRKLK